LQTGKEHGCRRDAAPAIEFPARAKEFNFLSQGDVENHLGDAAIELLRELEKRALGEVLAVGGAPDGDVEGFLLDLLGDGEGAKESVGDGFGDIERRAVAVGFEAGAGGDERKFEGHELVPFLFQRECSTAELLCGDTRLVGLCAPEKSRSLTRKKARVRDDKVWAKARIWDDNVGAFTYWGFPPQQ